jgi:D-sedoheptulose 7-phosphate isomerase
MNLDSNIKNLADMHISQLKENADSLPMKFTRDYIKKLKEILDELPMENIEKIADILLEAYEKGKYVYIMGNGGSAATAAHMVCDLAKGTIWPVSPGEKRFRVIGMSDNIPLMTAWTNDIDYSQVFREQLLNLIGEGDVVIGISGSGSSDNIIKAIEYANACSATTIGLSGCGGGRLKDTTKECIVVNSHNMERIEDVHLIISHIIKLYLNIKLNLKGVV